MLTIPTNLVLVVSSALGYYFFAGLRIFSIEFLHLRYGLGHAAAIGVAAGVGCGALIGVLAGGRTCDGLLARGALRARVWVLIVAYLASALLFLLGLLSASLALSLALFFLAALSLGAVNPPLDAARLDIMHPRLWGRAEGVRATGRRAAEAVAPFLFGVFADRVFGGGAAGLRATFLLTLIPLGVGGLVGLIGLRTYLPDAAGADAYAERTRGGNAR